MLQFHRYVKRATQDPLKRTLISFRVLFQAYGLVSHLLT